MRFLIKKCAHPIENPGYAYGCDSVFSRKTYKRNLLVETVSIFISVRLPTYHRAPPLPRKRTAQKASFENPGYAPANSHTSLIMRIHNLKSPWPLTGSYRHAATVIFLDFMECLCLCVCGSSYVCLDELADRP